MHPRPPRDLFDLGDQRAAHPLTALVGVQRENFAVGAAHDVGEHIDQTAVTLGHQHAVIGRMLEHAKPRDLERLPPR